MDPDDVMTENEFLKSTESLRSTFSRPVDPIITTTRERTIRLMEDHFINFDMLMDYYSGDLMKFAEKKKGAIRKILVQKGNSLNPQMMKNEIVGKKDIMIIICTTDGSIFGAYESRKIPSVPTSGTNYTKGKGGHCVFSLSGPSEMAFKAERKKRNGTFREKPFLGIFSNQAREDMFLSIKNFCLIGNNGGGMIMSDTYEEMYQHGNPGKITDFMEKNMFSVSCIGIFQIV